VTANAIEAGPGVYVVRVFAAEEAAALVALLALCGPWLPAPINADHAIDRDVRDAEILAADAQPALAQRIHTALATATGELAARLAPGALLREVQIVRYDPGGHYADHRDSPAPGATARALSVVCYLNDDFTGGATVFPSSGLRVEPERGTAIVFAPELLHRAEPLAHRRKYAITAWYHRT
jgi:Rps23 Pro-64 3,4-dihydroxylase Tpa1-like proline 4-hydroxylase